MAYVKTDWENLPSTDTPITDTALDNMENGIEYNDQRLNGTKPMGSIVVDDVNCKNMFNTVIIINGWIDGTTMRVNSVNGNRMAFIPCQPNTTYTISRSVITSSFRVSDYTTTPPVTNSNVDYTVPTATKNDSGTEITYTTSATAKYLIVHYANVGTDSADTITNSLASIQVELGSTATTYIPYKQPVKITNVGVKENTTFYANDFKCRNMLGINNYDLVGWSANNSATATYSHRTMVITSNGSAYSGFFGKLLKFANLDDNETYTVSFNVSANNSTSFQYGRSGDLKTTDISTTTQRLSITDIGSNLIDKNFMFYCLTTAVRTITITDIQLEIGSEATSDTEYKNFDSTIEKLNVTSSYTFDLQGSFARGEEINLNLNVYNANNYTTGSWTTIAQLPSGYYPNGERYLSAFGCGSGWTTPIAVPVLVNANGNVNVYIVTSNIKRVIVSASFLKTL